MKERDALNGATPFFSPSRRVLIVKLSSMGDLFHALPAAHVLKRHYEATVEWVVQTEYADLVGCFADVDRVIVFPRRRFLVRSVDFLRELRAESYDLVVDVQGLLKSALTARLARGRARVGPGFAREGTGRLYSVCPPRILRGQPRRHAVREIMDTVDYLGLDAGEPVFATQFPRVELQGEGPHVGLVPGTRWPSKNWPLEYFGQLADAFLQTIGGTVHLIGGPADRERCRRIVEGGSRAGMHDLSGTLDLVRLGGVLQALDIVVTNDTGPMHMAAAAGTPVVALFGPTDPLRTGPWGAGHRVLRARPLPDCAPCYRRHCRRGRGECMRRIPVESVLAAVKEMLQGSS